MRKYETGIPPGKCGIYGIEYKESGYVYVGQAKDIRSRIRSHIVRSIKIVESGLIKNDIDSFMGIIGWENFKFSILFECNLEDLDYFEQIYYIKCGGENLKNIESPKSAAAIGIKCYAMPEFLKSRAMYYVSKLIEEDCALHECTECLSVDYLKKEDELREGWVCKFRCNHQELEKYCKSSRNYEEAVKMICEDELKSVLEKISDIVKQDSSNKFINRKTKKFTDKVSVVRDIEKHILKDMKSGILSPKNFNYQSCYDKNVAKLYYTKEELEKIVILSNKL